MYFRLPGRAGYSVEDASELVLFLIIACAYAGVPASGEASITELSVIILFYVCAPFFQVRLRRVKGVIWSSLIVAALFYSVISAFFPKAGFEFYFHGLLKFLLIVTFIQYFNRRRTRDELILVLLSLLLVSASTIMTVSISFLALLVAFVGLVITFLMILSMRDVASRYEEHERNLREKESLEHRSAQQGTGKARAGRFYLPGRFFRLPWVSALVIFLVGAVIFFIVPRVGRGFFGWRTSLHSRVSGYSEEVSLGSVGDFIKDDSLVMRVKLEGVSTGSGPFYFRGNALDYYTGRGWRDSRGTLKYYYFKFRDTISLEDIDSLDEVVKQQIVLEPINSSILFAIPELKSISRPQRFRSLLAYKNGYLGLPHRGAIYDRISYTAWSVPSPDSRKDCERAYEGSQTVTLSEPPEQYVEIPADLQRIKSLASRVTDDENTVCGKIYALRDYFHRKFEYELNTPSERAADPVSDFLFNSKRGYCEYFATSMALLLRSEGIPCRVAAGYMTEDYNPFQDYYRIRQSNAHTWVEVYLPGTDDWLLVDPTPGGRAQTGSSSTWQWLRDIADAIKYRWDIYVVGLGLGDQYRMARRARQSTAEAGRSLARLPSYLQAAGRSIIESGALIYIVVVVAAVSAAWFFLYRRRPGAKAELETDTLKKEYQKLLVVLSTKGFLRRPQETPLELADRVEKSGEYFALQVKKATDLYLPVRFGQTKDQGPALSAISDAIRSIRRSSEIASRKG